LNRDTCQKRNLEILHKARPETAPGFLLPSFRGEADERGSPSLRFGAPE
jgi:hypothetical protein